MLKGSLKEVFFVATVTMVCFAVIFWLMSVSDEYMKQQELEAAKYADCWFSYCYLNEDACMDLPFYNRTYSGNMTDCEKLKSLCDKISNTDPMKTGLFCVWINSEKTCQCYSILDRIFKRQEYRYNATGV